MTTESSPSTHDAATDPDSYPFTPFVKIVGRGERLRRDLTLAEASDAMRLLLDGRATPAQAGAFFIGLRVKGPSTDEIRGFARAVRESHLHHIAPNVSSLVDLGIPHDGKGKTAQMAPAVAIILAAAGVPTVMMGDSELPTHRGRTGAGSVFEALGVRVELDPAVVESVIEATGVGYLPIEHFCPAWHALLPLRREIGLRTTLNTVERLLNPADAPFQFSGIFHKTYLDRVRPALTGTQASWIVQGQGGSIEMGAGRTTAVFAPDPADDLEIDAAAVGLSIREQLTPPTDPEAHAQLNAEAVAGQPGAAADQAALTAGAMLWLVGQAASLADGLARAHRAMESGAAQGVLEKLQAASSNRS